MENADSRLTLARIRRGTALAIKSPVMKFSWTRSSDERSTKLPVNSSKHMISGSQETGAHVIRIVRYVRRLTVRG